MKNAAIVILLGLLIAVTTAQQPSTAPTFGVSLDHTHCSLSTSNPGYCFATDGIWRQLSTDVAPVRIDLPAAAGVTSFNGQTGAVTSAKAGILYSDLGGTPPADAVTSVNGKKGAVVLAIQ